MNLTTIHVFAGTFGSREAAEAYCWRDWVQPPREDASPQEREAWESKYPKWQLASDLDVYLDEDFIELHFGSGITGAWESFVPEEPDRERIEATLNADDTLLILDVNALGNFEADLRSTARLRYLGAFRARR